MYIKPTASYRMSKPVKRMLALIDNPQSRGDQKRIMIQAELTAAIAPRNFKSERTPQKAFSDNVATE
jgi:hypothetical protein